MRDAKKLVNDLDALTNVIHNDWDGITSADLPYNDCERIRKSAAACRRHLDRLLTDMADPN
jgi:hypothetical protein